MYEGLRKVWLGFMEETLQETVPFSRGAVITPGPEKNLRMEQLLKPRAYSSMEKDV